MVFAAHNALDAAAGLERQPLPLLAVTGTPLTLRAARQATPLPTLAPEHLENPDTVCALSLVKHLEFLA